MLFYPSSPFLPIQCGGTAHSRLGEPVHQAPARISWCFPPQCDGESLGAGVFGQLLPSPLRERSSGPFLETCILYHTFSAVILIPAPRDPDSGTETDIILTLDCRKTQLGGDSKAHVTWSSTLCLLPQVIVLNYTWVEAFCSAIFPLEHKTLCYRRALTKQVLQALQELWSCRGQGTFQPQGSACEFKTNGKQMQSLIFYLSVISLSKDKG